MGASHDANKELTGANQGATRAERIAARLAAAFAPEALEVIDESRLHAGHPGARPESETHFRVRMTAASLAGKTRVEKQRAVNGALAAEFERGLHALALEIG